MRKVFCRGVATPSRPLSARSQTTQRKPDSAVIASEPLVSERQCQRGTELSMGWVDPWVGFGSVGSGWVEIFQFLVGWVGSTSAKVLKI